MNDKLLLSNQVCFLFYQIDREIISLYRPFLDTLGLTYPQYLVMLVLWEEDNITVGHLGERLALDTGTISPLVKRMEKAGLLARSRDPQDERVVRLTLTEKGTALKETAASVPDALASCLDLSHEEYLKLKKDMTALLEKIHRQKCGL
ncbi:MAG TPA: MarR family transcriptional regulator [Spirochaetota bacterium]|nr:MarR family transcriptional regulator [Spirochaetota bacterium]HPQ53538.1 MarR family transcriptional regulator [Spirochaetota bacterium]